MLPNIVNTVRLISRISLTAIAVAAVILFVMCVLSGMEPVRAFFHSLWISISGFITGGFAPTSQSIGYYHSFALEIVCMVLMLLGAINFSLYVKTQRGETDSFFRDLEIRTGAIWLIVATITLMASTCASGGFSDLMALLRRGVFMVVAAATTTGFQNVTNNQLTTVFFFRRVPDHRHVHGNRRFQRKHRRWYQAFAHRPYCQIDGFHHQETLSPSTARVSVRYYHLGRKVLTTDAAKSAMTVSALFVVTYLIGSLCGHRARLRCHFLHLRIGCHGFQRWLSSGIVSRGMPPTLEAVYIP